jgi:hypothetical protein
MGQMPTKYTYFPFDLIATGEDASVMVESY